MTCLLHSLAIVSLCILSLALDPRQTAPDSSEDNVMSGLYSVQGCGSNAPDIVRMLESMPPYLQPAITDTYSTVTSPAYNTFFKDINHRPFIRRILQNIAHGTAVLPGLAQPGFNKPSSPVIACLLPQPVTTHPASTLVGLTPWVQNYARGECAKYAYGSNIYSYWVGGTNIVVLCSSFFSPNFPDLPPKSRRPCTPVDRTANQFRGLGYEQSYNRRALLVHELVHVYVTAATNSRPMVEEVYQINNCFQMPAGGQWVNPSNYVFYVGSTSFPFLFIFIILQRIQSLRTS